MRDYISDLESLLWSTLEQTPNDHSPENAMIEHLAEVAEGVGNGEYDRADLVHQFKKHMPQFDILHWIGQIEAEGIWSKFEGGGVPTTEQ